LERNRFGKQKIHRTLSTKQFRCSHVEMTKPDAHGDQRAHRLPSKVLTFAACLKADQRPTAPPPLVTELIPHTQLFQRSPKWCPNAKMVRFPFLRLEVGSLNNAPPTGMTSAQKSTSVIWPLMTTIIVAQHGIAVQIMPHRFWLKAVESRWAATGWPTIVPRDTGWTH
jgi:hypothetical protein